MNKIDLFSNLTKINFLRKVAETGDLKLASSLLGITPSALTQAIKALEKHVESTLIVRDKKGIFLTNAGKNLLDGLEKILIQIEQLESVKNHGNLFDKIRIGAYDSIAIRYMPTVFSTIKKYNPELNIELKIGRSYELTTLVNLGHLDMAMVIEPRESENFDIYKIRVNRLAMYISNQIPSPDYKNFPIGCLSSSSDGRASFVMKTLKDNQLSSKGFDIQTDSFEVLLALCLNQKIVAILPDEIGQENSELKDVSSEFSEKWDSSKSNHQLCLIVRKDFSKDLTLKISEELINFT
ncbi:MAG: hypothetical protein COW00_14725 [Bdellovibrio sp. CG12_big_fil_rev_8_21_14_0_65_39_13]|nr:MAG: hypothetical protein COW78_14025 [Bdellovibrio sp. CG22_combo_CG10-13_8_21_14_all_39_27]PIQ58549.1 MAG: hypothetical protein COW00_14725 [Bdellovibrio sp. CG12_big_fil_rev_8_21_14_0_65_39_13]PIR32468.1 MAG: hypothetical protein COV37_19880 [Bdellovibrio sp. CG11_big_fil_rev_8_21_14_0_20_39_38]PJB53232.1 MAG: hypothetical protein CO099_08245 [Bdellovibrio sp. CG_4_9_14_3_um_filter_39_7]